MLTGRIRPAESRTDEIAGNDLEDVREKALGGASPEWELVSCVAKSQALGAVTATVTYARREPIREVEGADLDAVRAHVPDGWQLLSVAAD